MKKEFAFFVKRFWHFLHRTHRKQSHTQKTTIVLIAHYCCNLKREVNQRQRVAGKTTSLSTTEIGYWLHKLGFSKIIRGQNHIWCFYNRSSRRQEEESMGMIEKRRV